MKIGSLFSGIGGLELGLEWAGVGHTVWQCEINPFCRGILRRHWPEAQIFEDITTLGREVEIPPVDVICGGFPCQDISAAGRQAGLGGSRSGLFYEMVRIIRSVQPSYIVLENVANIIAQRDTLNAVLSELHQSGYDGEWSIVSAADVGAPHLRRRWFFIGWRRLGNADRLTEPALRGYSKSGAGGASCRHVEPRASGGNAKSKRPFDKSREGEGLADADHNAGPGQPLDWAELADADGISRQRWGQRHQELYSHRRSIANSARQEAWPPKPGEMHLWQALPVDHQPAICRGVDGVSTWLDNINRKQTLMALGNAVVPECAELVGHRLLEINEGLT
jgi:DNA (cytosine-5)-methyltransferase 1